MQSRPSARKNSSRPKKDFLPDPKRKIVVDSVHGDIEPSELEWKIIDTPSFQRLRKLKQLQMGYLVYPNATHTRFAHSLGVLKVMQRILQTVGIQDKQQQENLRLAALLHDIGHYPYSHLLEGIDNVILTEERITAGKKSALGELQRYPSHEEVGQEILLKQPDLLKILGGKERAKKVGDLLARTKIADPQLSKLIHSSLDMDRLDYLIRDSQATGVPYGLVDIHYLLNHIKRSPSGTIGISHKAIAAAEHLLLARSFLYRVVCQHKTIYGFEETARQLLRRLRNRAQKQQKNSYAVPKDGEAVLKIARSTELYRFTDFYLDDIFAKAANDKEKIVRILARAIISRRPPRLIWEKRTFESRDDDHNIGELFLEKCKVNLEKLAHKYKLHPGQFLICDLKPIGFESRGARMTKAVAKKAIEESEREEMIQVFPSPEDKEPVDIVSVKHSVLSEIGNHVFRTYRLYVVCVDDEQEKLVIADLKKATKNWLKD